MITKKFMTTIFLLFTISLTLGDIPQMINYQGILTDSQTNPLEGDVDIQFMLYESQENGIPIWEETQTVIISEGLFHVLLGSVNPIPHSVFNSSSVYLALQVGTDPEMIPRKQLVSVGYAFRANKADSLHGLDPSNLLKTINDMPPNTSGNIDLAEGSNITITPDSTNNQITISASTGSTSGDNLGNHKATKNINLNGHWLSGDGSNNGIYVRNIGYIGINTSDTDYSLTVNGTAYAYNLLTTSDITSSIGNIETLGGYIRTGSPAQTYSSGDIVSTQDIIADQDIKAGRYITCDDMIISDWHIGAVGGYIKTGSPTSSYTEGDIASTKNLIADDDVKAGGSIIAGTPTVGYSTGDIVAGDDVKAGKNVDALNDVLATRHIESYNGYIITGSPSSGYGNGDIVSTNDLIADDDLTVGGIKSSVANTEIFGKRKFYAEEAAEVVFIDRGQGQLQNGSSTIELDPIFLEAVTIDEDNPMMVQITLTSDCLGIFVSNTSSHNFVVKELMGGSSNATFNWKVCCKRKGYETIRMEVVRF